MTQVFVAIDTADLARGVELVRSLRGVGVHIKLGLEFFTAQGASGVARLRAEMDAQAQMFLDLKLHDIPNTVAGAVRAAADCGVDFLTLHASGGAEMMLAAQKAAAEKISLLAVTVLTSLPQTPKTQETVLHLAREAETCGVFGVVCSPHEIAILKKQTKMKLIVPGIRPQGAPANDQQRVMTPADAAALGADYLVIGRPITQADDPAQAARDILQGCV